MKDDIPILDDEYFKKKAEREKIERELAMHKARIEIHDRMYQKDLLYRESLINRNKKVRERTSHKTTDVLGGSVFLKEAVNRLAKDYFSDDSMDGATFEHNLTQKLKLYPGFMCPITSFTTEVVEKQKKPTTVGDILNRTNLVRVAVSVITAWFVLLLLHALGI